MDGLPVLVTCQSQGTHALTHTLINSLFCTKWKLNLQNEYPAVLKFD